MLQRVQLFASARPQNEEEPKIEQTSKNEGRRRSDKGRYAGVRTADPAPGPAERSGTARERPVEVEEKEEESREDEAGNSCLVNSREIQIELPQVEEHRTAVRPQKVRPDQQQAQARHQAPTKVQRQRKEGKDYIVGEDKERGREKVEKVCWGTA